MIRRYVFIIISGVQLPDGKPAEPTKKKVVYDTRKKNKKKMETQESVESKGMSDKALVS